MYWINLIGSSIFMSIAFYYGLNNFVVEKNSTKNKFLFLFFYSIFVIIAFLYSVGMQKMISNFIFMIICSYFFIYCKNLKKSIFFSSIIFIFTTLGELIISIFVSILLQYKVITNYNTEGYTLIFSILNSLFIIFMTANKKLQIKIKKIKLSDSHFYILMFFLIIILNIFIFKNYYIMREKYNFIINFVSYIFVLIIFIISFSSNLKKKKIEEQYSQMLEYVTKYEGIINEQGKKNHEYNNQLMILSGYLEDKKYKKVKEYLNTIIGGHKTGQNYKIRQLSNFPNGGLKGLMYYKVNKMEENNVKYYLYVSQDIQKEFDKFDVAMYQDITKVFGVFIDNAIEAAKDSDKKEVEIDIKLDEDYITITISNSYISDEISKVGKTGYSTKGKGHGYGLSLVKDIIRKNNRLETSNDYNDEYFTQTLLIDIKK